MNRKAASLVALFVAVVAMFLSVASVNAESVLDFGLVNKTGYGIKAVYISPSASDSWGDNILKDGEKLENNEKLTVKFHPSATATKWDIKIDWVDGGDSVYWKGYTLAEITTITLKYNRETGETSASTE